MPKRWLWHGRHVFLVDGATVTLPDTEDNQQAYPQPPSQKPGLGFPIIRMVMLLSLATAALQGLAFGPYEGKETGEPALLRNLLEQIAKGSIILADRYYCSYFMIALLQEHGVDVVMRLHQRRRWIFGAAGVLVLTITWWPGLSPSGRTGWTRRPTTGCRPGWWCGEVRTQVRRPGYRVHELVVVTTLCDAARYSPEDLTDLYHERWHVELDIRSIKTALGMEQLRCLSRHMVRKEMWVFWLAYNLVRKVSAQAALERGLHPRQISFTATKQAVLAGWSTMTQGSQNERLALGRALLVALGKEEVGNRPGRCEPRAVKRRRKPHRLLMKPRAEALPNCCGPGPRSHRLRGGKKGGQRREDETGRRHPMAFAVRAAKVVTTITDVTGPDRGSNRDNQDPNDELMLQVLP